MCTHMECIDWNTAWQSAQSASTFLRHDETFWNNRAASFADHANHKSDYPQQFLKLIAPESHWRVLDVGCGPGTVAIPLAPLVTRITALDFSRSMLEILKRRSEVMNITRITPVQAAWEDDWMAAGIGPHELVIASRSLTPSDLKAAIAKLNRFATRRVCISAPVGTGPFDQRIMAAVGRTFRPGPDYIYILNQLHAMGIYARLNFTVHPVNRTYVDHDDAVDECNWMLPDMTAEEENRLRRFFKANLVSRDKHWFLPGTPTVRWAVICWEIYQETTQVERERKTSNAN